jgi:hypothetical protein
MKKKNNFYPDEFKMLVVQEYLNSDLTQPGSGLIRLITKSD